MPLYRVDSHKLEQKVAEIERKHEPIKQITIVDLTAFILTEPAPAHLIEHRSERDA